MQVWLHITLGRSHELDMAIREEDSREKGGPHYMSDLPGLPLCQDSLFTLTEDSSSFALHV